MPDPNRDYNCINCGRTVFTDTRLSGVQNRNHCPYCLYSRHVDLIEAGDRLSPCKGRMKPVGLTTKRVKKKYGSGRGELMIVHRCEQCGKISINRIAADDDVEELLRVFEISRQLSLELKAQIESEGIELLGKEDLREIRIQLLGRVGNE